MDSHLFSHTSVCDDTKRNISKLDLLERKLPVIIRITNGLTRERHAFASYWVTPEH